MRFEGFGAGEDEWVNIKKSIRQRSLPLDSSQCRSISEGDLVLCFRVRVSQFSCNSISVRSVTMVFASMMLVLRWLTFLFLLLFCPFKLFSYLSSEL